MHQSLRYRDQQPEDMEPKQIKEGYLVKKGTVLNSWKVVWVVLSEDGVEFFKRKTDNAPKGMIPLKGAVLTSPCQDFSKRTFVFKLRTAKNQDHYFQASHLEERESWVKDIKRVITCLQGDRKFTRKSTRRSIRLPDTINLSELYILMRDQEDGVKELKLEKEKRVYNHCFTGGTVVDWLISKDKARNRPEALMLATGLLNEGFLQPAGDLSKEAVEGGAESAVLDDPDALYYFADSGFFCEGYSSDEDVILKEEFRGNIIKQGCLLKQGHRRKNWNVRKFILRDDPAYIHYYDPTKGDENPLGSIHLRGSVITAVEFVPEAKRYDVDGNLFEIITSDDTHYFLQATTPEERKEWIKAIHTVSKTGK
ncbi:pleckstrin-like [Salvelinus fontinalis]|uniref:Pleckstrin-like n=1 Tax=Salvelinus namaycush TaxID=8040 RepID=A0A8U0QNJ0_SALNM|nr:pleckstrin-like [Salvelinus namaycush]XP_055781468.1 pleckstrin-like [Salvelinus fontinalis]